MVLPAFCGKIHEGTLNVPVLFASATFAETKKEPPKSSPARAIVNANEYEVIPERFFMM